jgi:hypothetical protein
LTISPSNFEIGLDTIRFRDLLDDQVAVVELGIAKPKAEFEPRGDIFLKISRTTLAHVIAEVCKICVQHQNDDSQSRGYQKESFRTVSIPCDTLTLLYMG